MSLNILSIVSRNLGNGRNNVLPLLVNSKPSTVNLVNISCAGISSKANRDPDFQRKPAFPYKEKKYGMIRSWFDRTSERFDENSKIIIVDGPIAVGKTNFAKMLADDLDMHFVPEANMDMVCIDPYGFDERSLNDKLPENLQNLDEKIFCCNPFHKNAAFFQFSMFELRMSMYIDALAHLMNSGQGVVMVRSVYSDMVFAEAMAKCGYITKAVLKNYHWMRDEMFPELLRPHLQIYLDVPVPLVQERIKQRGIDAEVNGKALTPAYLSAIEDAYKRKFLPEIENHAELLIYDWSDFGDLELAVEDIERIDFDKYTVYDKKMSDWRFPKEQAIADARMLYSNRKMDILKMSNLPMFDSPELYYSGEEVEILEEVMSKVPSRQFAPGFNAAMGDQGILFNIRKPKSDYPYW